MNTLQLFGIGDTVIKTKEFNVIKTNLLLNLGDRKIISILPTAWGEEVPVLAAQLAEVLARGQRKVLLINADSVNRSFLETDTEESEAKGLYTILTGDTDFETCVCDTDIDGLSVLPAGPEPVYTSELLGGVRFAGLLDELKKQFDYIFVLLPALDQSLDGIAATGRMDGCIVITYTKTSFSKIKDAVAMLQKGTTLIGSILVRTVSPWKPAFSQKKSAKKQD